MPMLTIVFLSKASHSEFTALIIYVDDIVLTSNSAREISSIKQILHSNFHIKDLGTFKYFLGIEVAHSHQGISLCQSQRNIVLTFSRILACLDANRLLHPCTVLFDFMLIPPAFLLIHFHIEDWLVA